jgi:hypothetical protein
MLLILDLQSIHHQAQVGVGVPHIRLAGHLAPRNDLALVSMGSNVAAMRQVREGEGIACRTQEEEEAAGGDPAYSGVIPPQEESGEQDGQQADDGQWGTEVMGGGDANEPGSAEGDKGHGRICDGCGGSEGTGFSLSWSAVYGESWRGRRASQRSFGLHNSQVGEELGDFLLTLTHLQRIWPVVVEGRQVALVDGGLLGADGVVLEADGVTRLLQQVPWRRFHRCFSPAPVDVFR